MMNIIGKDGLNRIMGRQYEIVDSGYADGEENMRFDYNRTMECSEGKALPMLRLYAWKPWCVSLGANQSDGDIDNEACRRSGYDVVRRPTGGRAVLHANEITYSVVCNLPESINVHEAYFEIHQMLVEVFHELGAEEVEFTKSQPDFRSMYKEGGISGSCFASAARYEIELHGRKIVGSAQRLFGRTLLQHGSILLGPGHEEIAFLLKSKYPERQTKMRDFLLEHSATLRQACGRPVEYSDVADAVIRILEK